MKLALGAAALIVGMALAVSACGSGGQQADDDEYTGTVRSDRQERDASVMQQQDAGVDSGIGDGVEATGVIDFGHREGLAFLRNSVGDPEAPVLIVEYSDFQ